MPLARMNITVQARLTAPNTEEMPSTMMISEYSAVLPAKSVSEYGG